MPMNTVCHIEFPATDLERSRRFYEELFGWQFREFGPMLVFGTADGHVGGLTKADTVQPAPFTHVWIRVPDLDDYLARTPILGGTVVRPKHDLPEVGWSAEVADPDGNPVGLVQYDESRA